MSQLCKHVELTEHRDFNITYISCDECDQEFDKLEAEFFAVMVKTKVNYLPNCTHPEVEDESDEEGYSIKCQSCYQYFTDEEIKDYIEDRLPRNQEERRM